MELNRLEVKDLFRVDDFVLAFFKGTKETTNQKGDERQTHAQTERKKREGVVAAAVVVVAAAAGAAAAAVVVVLTLLNRAPIAASTMRETLTHNKNTRKRIVKRKKSHNALPDL